MSSVIITNFAISVAVIAACLFSLWLLSLKVKDASIIDIFWGTGFGVIALTGLALADQWTPYLLLLAALPFVWAVRLSVYLAARNLPHGEDPRYQVMRSKVDPKEWPMWSLKKIYIAQGLAMIVVATPVWLGLATGSATKIGLLSIIGALIWLIGFFFETVGDMQLAKFVKSMKDYDGAYEDKPVLDTGLWKYTRHPNYFGNATMWWGIWLVACQAPWGWVSIFAPAAMTYLIKNITGAKHLEQTLKKRPAYVDYVNRTSEFFPRPPKKT